VSSSIERERSPKRSFLSEIHSFRAVAIIAVVMTHVVDLLAWPVPPSLTERLIYSVAGNGTVLFLFVAGFLFQHLSARFNYADYLRGKLRNVIVPYLVISLPLIAYQYLRAKGIFADGRPAAVGAVLWRVAKALGLATHQEVPFWFIPMIAVLYLAAPLLLFIDRHPRGYWLIAPLLVLSMFAHRPFHYEQLGQSLVYFFPAYLVGMCFSHYRQGALALVRLWRWPLTALSLALLVLEVWGLGRGGAIFSDRIFSTEAGLVDLNMLFKLLASVLLVHLLSQPRVDARVRRRFDYLAGASFGVFFVHRPLIVLVLKICHRFGHREIAGGLGSLLVISAVVTALSLLVIGGVRAIAGKRSRYIVGC
jgi:surface polysaccharide O-acyltransferase-like enzyme